MGKAKKKGGGGKKQPAKAADDGDDDWEALLEAEASAPAATEEAKPKEEEAAKPAEAPAAAEAPADDAAAAFLAAAGLADEEGGGAKNKKKKKKKKGGAGGGAEATESAGGKVSARGKMVAERIRKQQEEEARIRAEEEEERRKIEEEERRIAEEERKKEEEKERRKQKHKEKTERQKKEGTYMTKAQKAKQRLAEQRLEAMRKAGMLPVDAGKPAEAKKGSMIYDDRKKKGKAKEEEKPVEEPELEEEEEPKEETPVAGEPGAKDEDEEDDWEAEADKEEAKEEESSGDEWDADSDDDDDNDDKFGDLEARLAQVKGESHDDEEDLVELEKKKEQERLRQLGLERAERDRIEAEKMAKIQAEQDAEARALAMIQQKRDEGKRKRMEQEKKNLDARSPDDLRCPVVVIMGHVDTGKTKLLDKIRKTNVQEGEAGGITQQIGATYFEKKTLEAQTAKLNETEKVELKVPGMLVIDTPGHESFTNLRSRGSSLCDVAILVVDLMHGLEQQTIESLQMLVKRQVPFVIALNKVDRCYGWKTCKDTPIRDALKEQEEGTLSEFRNRASEAKVQLMEQGVNSNIYWEMGDEDWTNSDFVPLVPTSAISGEGVQDVLLLLCQMAQRKITDQIMWHANLQCTVLEVKAIDGLGMTVDVLVVNGYLREGDRAVFCTLDGPIVTEIRGLLTPPPSREMRIKSEYIHHKEIKGALGVKVIGNNLDKVMAGTPVMVVGPDDEEEDIKAEVMSDLTKLEDKLSTDKVGVLVQASTLGALEALLQFLREETKPPIPVSAIGIGTIQKRDITKISIMNEKGRPEFATVLAFDVDVSKEAREHATEMGVRIMTADIIYHLFDQFTRFMDELNQRRREEAAAVAVFPSIVKILPQHIFNQKDPIIVGMEIVEGILKVGTPLCVPALGGLFVGKVDSIESNGREQETARKGNSVAVKIVNESNPTLTYGRQFDASNMLYSTLTRESIDALKAHFKDQLENEDWRLVVKLKKVFNII
uniref:Eukaryotic translation initiation factor 5B n=1 Tax=Entomoneis paludosa TaxID=265537 RepID=A0A7S2Y322_9STRA|mmetsp:Transcript_13234/g.27446  ORF Transcript_13234/g.27446 Transcript_13234/m.27446 type:complete len:999 (+) Transcript_13234:145-3141(+)|eukprot:CAMPEP_0172457952 /NCGR_PEP_ID=MMETSP1065-20121228/25227_1 /TAXON_ID=265537 /ORGANISM="Amphiprora paludosa, Strain CCMP125" /LENGTH=998 /DNA_ID=CAMNT_0013211971 /DNA_START=82 /DNA_END=3078 /DNA_ORIENTATION=-